MKKCALQILLIIFYLICWKSTAFAAEEFLTEYEILYSFAEDGITEVDQNIRIVNNQNDIIPTNYKQTIKKMNIYDVSLGDSDDIEMEIDKINENTVVTVNFKETSIGKGQTTNINLKYKTTDVAAKVGEIWNINIPRIEIGETTKKYEVVLEVPKNFGSKIFTSPTPIKEEEFEDKIRYVFNTKILNNTGITASFGQYQTLNFKLNYQLENNSSFTVSEEITLPPDIKKRQEVFYKSITPAPNRMRVDKDGNYLAEYKVGPNSILNIELIGSAKISGEQINPNFGGEFENIPTDIANAYTRADKYWEVNSPEIQTLAKQLFDESATVSENAASIYNFIVKNLEYDFEITNKAFIERNGALKAIQSEDLWACMEFTDLFIALARANEIPARELNGYAYAREGINAPLSINLKGGDVLHAWPEYYDPNFGWVAIDPTWGSTSGIDYFTKLDTNHFVFVIKGSDSEYPLPAGAYKLEGNEKQVEVDFASKHDNIPSEILRLYKPLNLNPLYYFDNKHTYVISNEGKVSVFNVNGEVFVLPPFEAERITLDKNTTTVEYEYFNGTKKVANLALTEGKPNTYSATEMTLISLFGVALLLCTIVYYLVIRLKVQKKSLLPLHLLRRDQDQ